MLKFAKVASVGDVIRAFDFKPMVGRGDCFIEGKVIGKGASVDNPFVFDCYAVECTKDVFDGKVRTKRVGEIIYVPFEVSFMEFDARIINLSK